MAGSQSRTRVWVVESQRIRQDTDTLATEEPLEIRLRAGAARRTLDEPTVAPELLYDLARALKERQGIFRSTGGLHAAALFDAAGQLVAVREDVGRHNALDKLIGWAVMEGRLPLAEHIVLVSGRASHELVQKCVAPGVPLMCAFQRRAAWQWQWPRTSA